MPTRGVEPASAPLSRPLPVGRLATLPCGTDPGRSGHRPRPIGTTRHASPSTTGCRPPRPMHPASIEGPIAPIAPARRIPHGAHRGTPDRSAGRKREATAGSPRMAPPGALYRPRAPPGGGGPRSVQPSPDFLRGRHNGIDHRPRAPCSRPQPPSRSPTRGCPLGHRAVQRAAPGQRPTAISPSAGRMTPWIPMHPRWSSGSCPTALSPPRNPGFRWVRRHPPRPRTPSRRSMANARIAGRRPPRRRHRRHGPQAVDASAMPTAPIAQPSASCPCPASSAFPIFAGHWGG